jgi:Ribosomal silencing factor during starvation
VSGRCASAVALVDVSLVCFPSTTRKYLTADEVTVALKSQGAEEVVVVDLTKKLDTISQMIVASGRSHRHLQKMGDTIVRAVCSTARGHYSACRTLVVTGRQPLYCFAS